METSRPCILVVDDDRDLRETLVELFEMEGYQVLTATNGLEALDVLERTPRPCVMLLDLMMPVMSGHQVLSYLDQIPQLVEGVAVVVWSAGNISVVPVGGVVRLALSKGPESEGLLHIVRELCQESQVVQRE